MIMKILFFALFGAIFIQEGQSRFPQLDWRFRDAEDQFAESDIPFKGGKSILTYDDGTVPVEENVSENLDNSENDSENGNNAFNELYEFPIVYSHPEDDAQVTTHYAEENDNAHEMHTHHHVPTTVPHTHPVTEHRTGKPSVDDFFDVFGHAINDVVNENAHNFNKEVGSVMDVGKSFVDAAKTIADSKIKLANSFPRIGMKVLDAWGKK